MMKTLTASNPRPPDRRRIRHRNTVREKEDECGREVETDSENAASPG